MDKHPVGKCLKEQNQSLNLMLFLSKVIEVDFFILEFFQTGWKMLRNKQIDHFENKNKSGAFGVYLYRNFSFVHFLFIKDKVSSMLINYL